MWKVIPTAGSSYGKSSGDAPDSICPKGWRLPGYDDNKSFYHLVRVYVGRSGGTEGLTQGTTVMQISPLSFLRSGRYSYESGSLDTRTSYGSYWSGRSYSITNSYYLSLWSTRLYPQYNYYRGTGFALRCLAR